MTAAIFNLAPQQVILAMDTLAVTADTKAPFFFTTKFYPLPHLQGVMFATGAGDFADRWFLSLQRFLAKDIEHLDEYVTSSLQALWRELGLSFEQSSTVYQIGYSEAEERYVGFVYRSTNLFKSERLGYGLFTKPGIQGATLQECPNDLIRLMELQRAADEALPTHEKVGIGGEIQMLVLQDRAMRIDTVHRFSDYEKLYQQMCDQLPANKY